MADHNLAFRLLEETEDQMIETSHGQKICLDDFLSQIPLQVQEAPRCEVGWTMKTTAVPEEAEPVEIAAAR